MTPLSVSVQDHFVIRGWCQVWNQNTQADQVYFCSYLGEEQ